MILKKERAAMWFIVIFLILPLAEIATFIQVGEVIGTPSTLLMCLITAVIGGYFVRQQGMQTLFKAQNHLRSGEMPVQEMFDGICLIATGAMMITPGFVTDTIGFLLLIPTVRVLLKQFLVRTGKFSMQSNFHTTQNQSYHDSSVIDGDFERVQDTDNQLK